MNPNLRDRILRKLESLSDERAYQVLDYVEFIESKYAERQNPPPNVFQRFAETVEDRLRAGRVSAATISEAMGLMNRAVSVLNGVAAAGKSVANDIVTAARPATPPTTGAPPAGSPVSTPPGSPQPAPQAPGPQPPAPQPAAAPPTGAQPAAPPSASSPATGTGSASTSAGSTPSAPPAPPSQPSGEQPT